MTLHWQAPAAALAADLRAIFGPRLQSVVAYGPRVDGDDRAPLSCLALVATLTTDDLEQCARASGGWTRAGLATPLILTADEFRRSLDTFPLEYGEIIRAHARVLGDDPFTGLTIDPADIRRACETQLASHLVHLREGFMESGGRPSVVAQLVAASAPAFTAILRNLARLDGTLPTGRVEATQEGARLMGVSASLVADMLRLEGASSIPTVDSARLFPAYLEAVEHMARTVDAWHT